MHWHYEKYVDVSLAIRNKCCFDGFRVDSTINFTNQTLMICTSKKCVLDGFRSKNVWFQYIAL